MSDISDSIKAPSHYRGDGAIECMDAAKSMMTNVQWVKTEGNRVDVIPPLGFYWWGCAFKYLWRWVWKNGIQDLKKCRQCIDYLIDMMREDEALVPEDVDGISTIVKIRDEMVDFVTEGQYHGLIDAKLDQWVHELNALIERGA